jgi:hypothetical protein
MTNNPTIDRNLVIAGVCLGLYALVLMVFDFSTPGERPVNSKLPGYRL